MVWATVILFCKIIKQRENIMGIVKIGVIQVFLTTKSWKNVTRILKSFSRYLSPHVAGETVCISVKKDFSSRFTCSLFLMGILFPYTQSPLSIHMYICVHVYVCAFPSIVYIDLYNWGQFFSLHPKKEKFISKVDCYWLRNPIPSYLWIRVPLSITEWCGLDG